MMMMMSHITMVSRWIEWRELSEQDRASLFFLVLPTRKVNAIPRQQLITHTLVLLQIATEE